MKLPNIFGYRPGNPGAGGVEFDLDDDDDDDDYPYRGYVKSLAGRTLRPPILTTREARVAGALAEQGRQLAEPYKNSEVLLPQLPRRQSQQRAPSLGAPSTGGEPGDLEPIHESPLRLLGRACESRQRKRASHRSRRTPRSSQQEDGLPPASATNTTTTWSSARSGFGPLGSTRPSALESLQQIEDEDTIPLPRGWEDMENYVNGVLIGYGSVFAHQTDRMLPSGLTPVPPGTKKKRSEAEQQGPPGRSTAPDLE